MTRRFHRHDEPLTSEDLAKCQVVLDAFCHDNDVSLPSEEAIRVGAIIIEMYQQGIRDANHLRILVDAARGVVQKQRTRRKT